MFSSLELLLQLKKDYSQSLVSVLVGAGMSKNAYETYPSWVELLKDVVLYLYEDEYNLKLANFTLHPVPDFSPDESALNAIIQKYGSLEIVSEYIKRKGINHEAIDAYIEKRIPVVKKEKRHYEICGQKIGAKDLKVYKALLECGLFANIYTTNYDNLLELSQIILNLQKYSGPIVDSQGLSNSLAKPSIIKIHGSLRSGDDNGKPYGFDNDKNTLYIISKEDYETYPQKHEAFSILMKLAMLRGKFLLVGFSGNDPNYLQWLQWMKDVLDKAPDDNKVESIKVYLIDANKSVKDNIPEDRQLFFENHHIGVIRLFEKNVITEILGGDSLLSLPEKRKVSSEPELSAATLLEGLFSYIKNSSEDEREMLAGRGKLSVKYTSNSTYLSEYNQLWSEIDSKIRAKEELESYIEKVRQLRLRYSLPKIVHYQNSIINTLVTRKEKLNTEEAEVFALACYDMGLLPCCFGDYAHKDVVAASSLWNSLWHREETLDCASEELLKGSTDEIRYENILRLAFQFRFDELRKSLGEWKPKGEWIQKKATFLSLFVRDTSVLEPLDKYIEKVDSPILKMNASIIANVIYSQFPSKYPLDEYWNQGFAGISEISKYIIGRIDEKKEDIRPYGNTARSFAFSKSNTSLCESLRLLYYIIEWGISTSHRSTNYINGADWYKAFRHLYKLFPYPCLYYSIQYIDKNLLRRIGQDFAYDFDLRDWTSRALVTLLDSIGGKNTPKSFIYGMLILSGELYISVSEEMWYDSFLTNVLCPMLDKWNEFDENDELFGNVCKAVDNIKNAAHVKEVFILFLKHIDKNPRLANVIICDKLHLDKLEENALNGKKEIENLIEGHSLKDTYSILYVLNHYKLLTSNQSTRITQKAKSDGIDFSATNHVALIQLSYLFYDKEILEQIKKYVLRLDIWNCGISEKMFVQPSAFAISRLSPFIMWTPEEIEVIFSNMELNLHKMEAHKPSDGFDKFWSNDYVELLYDMQSYLFENKSEYPRPDLKKLIDERLMVEQGFLDSITALQGEDVHQISNTVNIINAEMEINKSINGHTTEISLIIDRLLLKQSVGMNFLLSEISYLLKTYKVQMIEQYGEKIRVLLKSFQNIDYRQLNISLPLAYKSLHNIADILKDRDRFEEVTNYWLNSEDVKRFAEAKLNNRDL